MKRCFVVRCAAVAAAGTSSSDSTSSKKNKMNADAAAEPGAPQPKGPAPPFPDHSAKSKEDLLKLIREREEDIVHLKKIHELSLRRLEKVHRRHLLEYEEKAMMFEENVNRFTFDVNDNAAYNIKAQNKRYDAENKSRKIMFGILVASTCIFWAYLATEYPYNSERVRKTSYLNTGKVNLTLISPFSNPETSARTREIPMD
eukprot:PhM_4_TR13540/c0_g1_i1/m.7840